jgi:hypothetical protein
MNYELIIDEEELDKFIEWLPNLKKDNSDNEVFYMCLFARKKYFPNIISSSNDKTQLRRELVNKSSIKRELRKWECKLGSYQLKKDTVPQEALAVYITPNPRSMKHAMFNLTKDMVDFMSKSNIPHNLHQNAISAVQRSKSYTYVVDFDIDTKDIDLESLKQILPQNSPANDVWRIIETRGGYHIVVNPKLVEKERQNQGKHLYEKQWYQIIKNVYNVDQAGDQMVPIVGTFQGGFVPKFITI